MYTSGRNVRIYPPPLPPPHQHHITSRRVQYTTYLGHLDDDIYQGFYTPSTSWVLCHKQNTGWCVGRLGGHSGSNPTASTLPPPVVFSIHPRISKLHTMTHTPSGRASVLCYIEYHTAVLVAPYFQNTFTDGKTIPSTILLKNQT